MLVNLVPEFLAVLAAPDPPAAYHDYLERHGPVLQSYWRNYVLDPTSPHAERVIAAALRAERADLERLLEDVDVAAIADEALGRSLEQFEADCPVDLYLMVGVGAAQAVAPGFEPWEYFGYTRRQYRRIRELDAFLRRAAAPLLDESGLGLRLRFLSGGMSAAARMMGGRMLPERSGYYLGLRLVESYLAERGIASTLRAATAELRKAEERALGMQSA